MRMLYVEDNPLDGDLTRRALGKAAPDCHLEIVATYRAAVARLAADPAFDLVLTDLRLPDGNGLDLLAHIRSRDLALAVVIATGTGDEETVVAALKAGADDYVIKRANYLDRLPLILEDAFNHHCAEAALRAHRLRVLYAEHCDIDIDLTRRHLARHAPYITLDAVHNATEILQRLSADGKDATAAAIPYDVILLDYRLPGWNALEILRELRHTYRLKTPVVLVTGQGDEEVALAALKSGAADYVPKNPGYLFQLPGVLENAYHHAQLGQEEAALRENAAKLREAQALGRIGNWEYDLRSQALTWSDQVYVLYGRDPALGPPTVAEDAAYYTPEQTARLRDYARRAIEEGQSFNYDLEMRRADGTRRYFAATMRPMWDENHRVTRLFGTVQDITERQQIEAAERQQRELAEALRDTAAVLASTLSLDEVLDRILTQAARVVPYDAGSIMLITDESAHIVRSRGFAEQHQEALLQANFRLADVPSLNQMAATGEPLAISDTLASSTWIDLSATHWVASHAGAPMRVRGKIIGFLNLDSRTPGFYTPAHAERLQAFADQAAVAIENARLYDEIRRHAAELEQRVAERTAELRAANEQLQELNRMKSDFVSNVSHELRTPLTSIKSYIYLLERGKPEKQAQYIATLRRETELLQHLIEDLLHISRLDLGKVQPNLAPVDLNGLMTLLAEDRATLFADRNLALEVRPAPDLPAVPADEKMLIQVLTNLMTNAMNYTPSGGTVTVSTAVSEQRPENARATEETWWVTCSVSDTGPGIPPEEQAHLFERFFRGSAAHTSRAPGTGLGLAICREIIDQHGGQITCQSEVGQGSTFTAWLPVSTAEVN